MLAGQKKAPPSSKGSLLNPSHQGNYAFRSFRVTFRGIQQQERANAAVRKHRARLRASTAGRERQGPPPGAEAPSPLPRVAASCREARTSLPRSPLFSSEGPGAKAQARHGESPRRSRLSGDEPRESGFSLPPSPPLPTPKQNKGQHLLVPVLVGLD